MQCDDFANRLNDLLDLRRDPAGDRLLAQHARRCADCDSVLRQWRRIGSALAPQTTATERSERHKRLWPSRLPRKMVLPAAALAATLLGVLWLPRTPPSDDAGPEMVAEVTSPADPEIDFDQIGLRVRHPQWWGSVVRAAWEPVDPLADSFRPLTDSFQTAFELLTPRGQGPTVIPATVPDETQVSLAVVDTAIV